MQLSYGVLFKQIIQACPKTIVILNNLLSLTSSIPSISLYNLLFPKKPAAFSLLSISHLDSLSGISMQPNKNQKLNQPIKCVLWSHWTRTKKQILTLYNCSFVLWHTSTFSSKAMGEKTSGKILYSSCHFSDIIIFTKCNYPDL